MLEFLKNIGPSELIIIGVVLVLFFGSKKVVSIGRDAGEATKEFKKIKSEFKGAIKDVKTEPVEETNSEGVSK